MTKYCPIVEDLLPLYSEGLLQEETLKWVEAHIKTCDHCKELVSLTEEPIKEEIPSSPINHEKMMAKINTKLALYQIIFVGLSFFMAIRTTLLNESFGFILSYAILGLILYLFYKSYKIVTAITFLPVFFWSIGTMIGDISIVAESLSISKMEQAFHMMTGSFMVAGMHLAFAIIGATIGLLITKMKEKESEGTA